jgi:hypothetical protein
MLFWSSCSIRTPLDVIRDLAHNNPLTFQPLVPLAFQALTPLLTNPLAKSLSPDTVAAVVSSGLCGSQLFQIAPALTDAIVASVTHSATDIASNPSFQDQLKVRVHAVLTKCLFRCLLLAFWGRLFLFVVFVGLHPPAVYGFTAKRTLACCSLHCCATNCHPSCVVTHAVPVLAACVSLAEHSRGRRWPTVVKFEIVR